MTICITYLALCFLIYYCGIEAVLELEQPGMLYVCPGRALNVKCSTSADLLQWNVTIPTYQRTWTRELSRVGKARTSEQISTSLTSLNVTRTLNNSLTLPLVSKIIADNVATDLNETEIVCQAKSADRDNNNTILASAGVQIILPIGSNINITPNVNICAHFEMESVTVVLLWTHKNGVSYSVSVDRQVAVNYTGRNGAQLVVSYNTKYNVSVIASLCGRNSTNFSAINYVTCHQLELDYSMISYSRPAIEGTIATFSCPAELVLTGPNTTTCMENGEWEPDLKETMCKVDCRTPMVNSNVSLDYNSTLEDSLLTFWCDDGLLPDVVFTARCYRNGSWIPNPSSHVCATSTAANCGDPSPPSDGYIDPYTSTSEGARINIVHVCQDGRTSIEGTVCSPDGQWKYVNGSTCTVPLSSSINTFIVIGTSLGGLIVLLSPVVIIIIVATIAKRKGSLQRKFNISTSLYSVSEEHKNYDNQGEYSLLKYSVSEHDVKQIDLKSEYSVLHHDHVPELENSEKQTNSDDGKCQTTTLVYADVVSFRQKPSVSTVNLMENRVEYAQLKEHNDKFVATSSATECHQVDYMINLDSLLIQLKAAVTDKWYQFGKTIGIEKDVLDKCTHYSSDQSLVEILDNWLRNHSTQPTWNEIADALNEIGLEQLAVDIRSVYKTGKLSIEVDMNALDSQLLPHHLSGSATELPPPIPPRQT